MPTASRPRQAPSPLLLLDLVSPLPRAVVIGIEWDLTDPDQVTSVEVVVKIATLQYQFAFKGAQKELSLCLPQGLSLPIPASLEVTISVEGTAGTPETLSIAKAYAALPDPESARSVYTENQNELRRTRTLYESLVIAVTVGFAALFAQTKALADVALIGREILSCGLVLLMVIVVFLVKEMAARYYSIE